MAVEDTDGDSDILPFPLHQSSCNASRHSEPPSEPFPFPTREEYDHYFDFEIEFCKWTRQVPHIMKFRDWQRHVLSLPAGEARQFIVERRDSPSTYFENALKEAM